MKPPSALALSFCPGCGTMGILVHAISDFSSKNTCARCRPERTIEVALYKFDRMGTELSGRLLGPGSAPGGDDPAKREKLPR